MRAWMIVPLPMPCRGQTISVKAAFGKPPSRHWSRLLDAGGLARLHRRTRRSGELLGEQRPQFDNFSSRHFFRVAGRKRLE